MTKQDDKKLKIIMGLKRCLSEESFDSITTRKIAKAADMSLGLLHYYFKNKEEILFAYTEYIMNEYLNYLEELDTKNIKSIYDFFEEAMKKTQESDKVKEISISLLQIKSLALNNQTIKDKYLEASSKLQKAIKNHLLKFNNNEVYVEKLAVLLMTSVDGMNLRRLFHENNKADYELFLSLVKSSLS